ncbi:helix-turn-helix transcriptional regulator [Subsaximicrobium wynnwilliamsii]|uniref:Helix-turn-helix transcriptional regulator n=1 Tax=Subsaximicrobium wynnwilliamsii TaxID=291179 RepID=A0A5C6ZH99_9FLAO|nr:helix-turn-helix transcriptional regulator [Subsaximicrobium wynnwilliamsii]TXD82924.1 helix-turn-helix transcriptional regulator [Subsaximicrobium wynnwilliamsii]TXD88645.1 helix-turn-helix transcriptional regulator [Subsaximicrobium wynnwilliamsii]TXE02738.1 helix-turn-helix transcriptional regulator [Subsaximicrobium wynnwilliamsii]
MINTEEFVIRLQKVIDHYGESASSFAEKIGVQRSSISHILSGRNKPSLDFVLKVLASFPDVELYWLLNGKGHFPSEEKHPEVATVSKVRTTTENETGAKTAVKTNLGIQDKSIERIVIFYTDGSFKNFEDS